MKFDKVCIQENWTWHKPFEYIEIFIWFFKLSSSLFFFFKLFLRKSKKKGNTNYWDLIKCEIRTRELVKSLFSMYNFFIWFFRLYFFFQKMGNANYRDLVKYDSRIVNLATIFPIYRIFYVTFHTIHPFIFFLHKRFLDEIQRERQLFRLSLYLFFLDSKYSGFLSDEI